VSGLVLATSSSVTCATSVVVDTRHYRIHSTASPQHAADVGQALEELHAAYAALFPIAEETSKFAVVGLSAKRAATASV